MSEPKTMKTEEINQSERGLSPEPCSASERLASRWSELQIAKAMSVVNDIAEEIDEGESRAELREALAIYADLLCDCRNDRTENLLTRTLATLEKLYGEKQNVTEQQPAPTKNDENR